MGVESYLIADSMVGIIAQRLVRRLCECKKPKEATVEENSSLVLIQISHVLYTNHVAASFVIIQDTMAEWVYMK